MSITKLTRTLLENTAGNNEADNLSTHADQMAARFVSVCHRLTMVMLQILKKKYINLNLMNERYLISYKRNSFINQHSPYFGKHFLERVVFKVKEFICNQIIPHEAMHTKI